MCVGDRYSVGIGGLLHCLDVSGLADRLVGWWVERQSISQHACNQAMLTIKPASQPSNQPASQPGQYASKLLWYHVMNHKGN